MFLLFFVDEIENVVGHQGDCKSNVEFDAIVVDDFRPASLRFSLLHQNINRVRELAISKKTSRDEEKPCNFQDGSQAPLLQL